MPLVRGDWDALVTEKPVRVTAPQMASRVIGILRNLLIAAAPLALIYLLATLGAPMDPTVGGYLKAAAILWASISLMLMIDPQFADKLKLVKEAKSLIRGKGEK